MSRTSEGYRDIIISLITSIEERENEPIEEAGGHSNMAAEEAFYRAGGLAAMNPLLDAGTNLIHGALRSTYVERTPGYAKAVLDAYGIASGDVLIIANAYGINAMTVDCALECK